jgi:hypothetical protein
VEQDFWSQQRQLDTGVPDALDPPHLDPWTTTEASAPDADSEAAVRVWLAGGRLSDVTDGRVDEGAPAAHVPVVEVEEVSVLDLFSAGSRVAFHAKFNGAYAGGLGFEPSGQRIAVAVAGMATVHDGTVSEVHAVTDRFGASLQLLSVSAP